MKQLSLTEDDIQSLIISMATPIGVGFLFHTLFNLVDIFYAGQISTSAVAGLNASQAFFFIIIAISAGLSKGTTALVSNYLGISNKEDAYTISAQSVTASIIIPVFIATVGYCFLESLISTLDPNNEYTKESVMYLMPIYLGNISFLLLNTVNGILTAKGKTRPFRNFLIGGFFLNLILNPVFIYGIKISSFTIIPEMGVTGIGISTVIAESCGAFYLLYVAIKFDLLPKSIDYYKFDIKRQLEIAYQSVPATLSMGTIALGIYVITYFASKFGQDVVAAYGIAVRVEQLALLPTIGINFAVLSIVGQNYGARRYDRVHLCLQKALQIGLVLVLTTGPLIYIFRKECISIFSSNPDVIASGAEYIKVAVFILYSYVLIFVSEATLQGLKRPIAALSIGVTRQLILPIMIIPQMLIFIDTELGIWWSLLIINWIMALFSFIVARAALPTDPTKKLSS